MHPTLKFMEGKYAGNQVRRTPYKGRVKNAIDMALLGGKTTLQELLDELKKHGIYVALRQAETGLIYGITYVDHNTKCVFNGSDLGKQYSAKAIQERCQPNQKQGQHLAGHAAPLSTGLQPTAQAPSAETKAPVFSNKTGNILEVLLQPEQISDYMPYPLKARKKKKGKKPGQLMKRFKKM